MSATGTAFAALVADRTRAAGNHGPLERPRSSRLVARLPVDEGSYSYWKVGQYTKFAGMERKRQGACHFTSIDFQGYLNGAVETGERAAGEILADLK